LKAIESIRKSKVFKNFLELLLAVGNYLNSGFRGGAYGFKLDAILKLSETKSSSSIQDHHLGHYLVELINKKFPFLLEFKQELSPTTRASKVNLPTMKAEVGQIVKGVATLKKELEVREKEKEKDSSDDFEKVMRPFFGRAELASRELTSNIEKVEKDFLAIVETYGEDPKSMTSEEFFGIFAQFLEQWIGWEKQINQWKQQEELEKKKKMTQEFMKKQGKPMIQKEGGFDEIISAVRTGEAFDPRYEEKSNHDAEKNKEKQKKEEKKEKERDRDKDKEKSSRKENKESKETKESSKESKKPKSDKKSSKKGEKGEKEKKKKKPSALDRSD